MITLTRLNREPIQVNPMNIESLESQPDTRVNLMNGRQLVVLEKPEQVVAAIHAWYRDIFAGVGVRT